MHWLWWKYRCHEGSPLDFQKLFEDVLKRAKPEFMQIRAYGKIGDRKCDGLLFQEGVVFQVYSPDELKQAQMQAKIEEDLAGAVAYWGKEVRKWIFVYNARRGVAPDLVKTLLEQRTKHPAVEIEAWSSDRVWEMTRDLSLQQRVEILGAPSGYEHLFLSPGSSPQEVTERLRQGRFVIIQDVLSPIDVQAVIEAMRPEQPFGAPIFVRPSREDEGYWQPALAYQTQVLEDVIAKSRDVRPRFAVFSLAPIPLALHLGFLLSDRLDVRAFQFNRDRRSWAWDEQEGAAADMVFRTRGVPEEAVEAETSVIVRLSLSASIRPDDTTEVAGDTSIQIDVSVDDPDVMWLRYPEQLVGLGVQFRGILKRIRQAVPECQVIHLFYAGPTGGAVVLGQAINPRMNPSVRLYEYSRQHAPRYRHVATLPGPGR